MINQCLAIVSFPHQNITMLLPALVWAMHLFVIGGYPGRYYAVLRNTAVIPAIFGSIFRRATPRIGSNEWSKWIEGHKNVLKTLWLGV